MREADVKGVISGAGNDRAGRKRSSSAVLGAGLLVAMATAFSGVSLHPAAVHFGSTSLGVPPAVRTVKLTNHSRSEFRPARIEIGGPAAMDFQADHSACATVRSGQSCSFQVAFQPRFSGARVAYLAVIAGNGTRLESELRGDALECKGCTAPKPSALPSPGRALGETRPPDESSRTEPIALASPAPEGSPASTPSVPLVTPTPDVIAETPAQPNPPAPVHPLPPPAPVIRVEPTDLDFTRDRQQLVYVFNDGDSPLQVSAVLRGQNPERFLSDDRNCASGVAPGQSCRIVIRFQPQSFESGPRYAAQLQINNNAPQAGAQLVALRREQVAAPRPHAVVTPDNLDFSPFYSMQSARAAYRRPQLSFTIVNDGPVALFALNLRTGFLGGDHSGPFAHTNRCHRLAPGERCTEDVAFTPSRPEKYRGRIYVFEGALQNLAVVDLQANIPRTPAPTPLPVQTPVGVTVLPQGDTPPQTAPPRTGNQGTQVGPQYGPSQPGTPQTAVQHGSSAPARYGVIQKSRPTPTPTPTISRGAAAASGRYGTYRRPSPTPTPPVLH